MKNIILKSIVALSLSITLTNAQSYEARGVGSIGQHYNLHPTQKMLMARESAIIDAQRRLMEFVVGAKIKSDTTRQNTALLSETVRSQSEGLVRRAKIISERQIGTQAYEVVMAIVDEETQIQVVSNIASNDAHKEMNQRQTPISHDYVNNSLDISPRSGSNESVSSNYSPAPSYQQTYSTAIQNLSSSQIEDDAPPAWLFDKKEIIEYKSKKAQSERLADLERINKLKSEMIDQLKNK
ncbi:MAG: hypothetical protein COB02_18120 [Candidatus Cloacimonadota bacterium]|nr:MAG: hypothetical protein COB02_18120 [Candidatus Cloacimonadota bacterium]